MCPCACLSACAHGPPRTVNPGCSGQLSGTAGLPGGQPAAALGTAPKQEETLGGTLPGPRAQLQQTRVCSTSLSSGPSPACTPSLGHLPNCTPCSHSQPAALTLQVGPKCPGPCPAHSYLAESPPHSIPAALFSHSTLPPRGSCTPLAGTNLTNVGYSPTVCLAPWHRGYCASRAGSPLGDTDGTVGGEYP